ncbi:MAG: pilus assembly protein PilY [Proteobacteria bacterium]|nr:pilus assembly protein PilY [Pseudomonadota bacterium]
MALAAVSAFSVVALGQGSPPSIPAVALSADPLYASTTGDKPALTLALSVEFPTVGAQYRGSNDYGNGNEYLGYYDAESCYEYNKAPTETPASGLTRDDYKRFDRVGPASNRMCNTGYPNAFSGNFLNWAGNSAIDMLRLALTGGDRSVDTDTLTVLQRAYLPDGNDNGCYFNNGSYFPAKQLKRKPGGTLPDFFGAVPASMIKDAGSNDIWIANMLNRIYFRAGSASTGNCTDQSGYTLGTAPSSWVGTQSSYSAKPGGWPATPSYSRGTTITLTGVQEVLYGNGSNWKSAPASGTIACSETTFNSGSKNSSATCLVRAYTGSEAPPAGLSADPFFYARVSVCNVDASGNLQDVRDYGLCTKYPKTYKPTGAIQKYSDQLKLAAFGYLMDQRKTSDYSERYGGVLRAPMKYVGAKTFDDSGNEKPGTNPKAEWDPDTGVFKPDPDGPTPTYSNSGVINYLNQFGRTGTVKGRYKALDPVGELYGEALRYLQGLAPTADAISGTLTAEMYDGFPAFTTWSDPYGGTRSSSADYSCVKSNIVVIGDVNTWDSQRLLTRTADSANNLPDFKVWSDVVKKFEANNTAGSYTDGQGVSRTIANPNAANTQSQVGANGKQGPLVGAAYWAHTHDIRGKDWTKQPTLQRPGLRVKSFFFDVNENSASNDAAYRRNQNQYFTAAKYGGFETDPTNLVKNPYNAFGNPFKRQDGTNDNNVWQDPAHPGEASTYYLQSDARGVLSAFDSIFNRASTAARSIAGAAMQSKDLSPSGSTVFQGTFDTSDWSGDLLAIPVTVDANNKVTLSNTETWAAAARLAALPTPAATRNIVMGRSGATALPAATPFLWDSIDAEVQTALNRPSAAAPSDGLGQDRLNYLRGDRAKEGSVFRKRNKLLGDIINSGVVHSGAPATNLAGPGYAAFYEARKGRTPAVFVGANDGMFHAFNAVNGTELFAYVPSWFATKLSALTSPGYLNAHQSYADGSPGVGEAQLGKTGTLADWKTVLIAGTGGGGQGVFALDVTDPANFSAANVLWEFTHADDADLGYVVGQPQILKLRTSKPGDIATYKWFAVVGSGVNNYVPDSAGLFSANGNPALFLLDLAKPAGTAWSLGTNYYKITLPVDATLAAARATGLINFQAALGPAREVAQIYLGDLHGNLWKLDFTGVGSSDWILAKLSPYSRGTPPTPSPLFIAKDGAGNVQPISMAPTLVYGAAPGASYIVFGTGKYLESSDRNSTAQQTVYMVYDNGSAKNDTSPAGPSAVSGRGRLQAGTANATSGAVTVPVFTLGRAAKDSDTTQRSGWYVDFPTLGERQISGATVVGESVVFGSLIPNAAGGGCAAAGGGNQYTMNFARGSGTTSVSTVGIMGKPLVTRITGATTYSSSDSTGRRTKTIRSQVIQQGSTGLALAGTETATVIAGRLSWRQINNYQDLRNAP